mmetsp:Transcript_797/g.4984  ORF Transcript_797/g.4984 Transcript_797/m.4984 type:complete len:431 (-) Transcript_797:1024-2316(-)
MAKHAWSGTSCWKAMVWFAWMPWIGFCMATGTFGREAKAGMGAFEIRGKPRDRRPTKAMKEDVEEAVRRIVSRTYHNEGHVNNVTANSAGRKDSLDAESCVLRDGTTGAVYDLSPLHFLATDMRSTFVLKGVPGGRFDHPHKRYNYYFNLCGNVPNLVLPQTCKDAGLGVGTVFQTSYEETFEEDYEEEDLGDRGEQLHHFRSSIPQSEDTCFRLGSLKNWGFQAVDRDQPQWGVSITYQDGQMCRRRATKAHKRKSSTLEEENVEWEDFPRETKIVLLCDPFQSKNLDPNIDLEHEMDEDHYAEEEEMCQYTIVYSTVYACPQSYTLADARSKPSRILSWLSTLLLLSMLVVVLGIGVQAVRRREWIALYTEHLKEPATRMSAIKKNRCNFAGERQQACQAWQWGCNEARRMKSQACAFMYINLCCNAS